MAEFNIQTLKDFIEEKLQDSDCFLVKAEIRSGSDVIVEIDSDTAVDIDFVSSLSREIESHFSPEIENYNLEVGSVGLTSPLVLPRQYKKNIGNEVSLLTPEGKKLKGTLKEADDEGFVVEVEEKIKKEGAKRPSVEPVDYRFRYDEAKKVTYEIKFD